MAYYRKKPVVIQAEQFVIYDKDFPKHQVFVNGVIFPVYNDSRGSHIIIPTAEGNMRADNLDWIIRGVNGELYPCKPDIFAKTYDFESDNQK